MVHFRVGEYTSVNTLTGPHASVHCCERQLPYAVQSCEGHSPMQFAERDFVSYAVHRITDSGCILLRFYPNAALSAGGLQTKQRTCTRKLTHAFMFDKKDLPAFCTFRQACFVIAHSLRSIQSLPPSV